MNVTPIVHLFYRNGLQTINGCLKPLEKSKEKLGVTWLASLAWKTEISLGGYRYIGFKASPVLLTFNGEVRGEERESNWLLISGLFYG